jgi:hypothetical protein
MYEDLGGHTGEVVVGNNFVISRTRMALFLRSVFEGIVKGGGERLAGRNTGYATEQNLNAWWPPTASRRESQPRASV